MSECAVCESSEGAEWGLYVARRCTLKHSMMQYGDEAGAPSLQNNSTVDDGCYVTVGSVDS